MVFVIHYILLRFGKLIYLTQARWAPSKKMKLQNNFFLEQLQRRSIILGDRVYSSSDLSNLIEHESNFRPVLAQLRAVSNQKIAVYHQHLHLECADRYNEYDLLSRWQQIENLDTPFPNKWVDFLHDQAAHRRWLHIKKQFTEQPNLEELLQDVANNVEGMQRGDLISANYWDCLHLHPFYDEMVTRVALLFTDLTWGQMEFLTTYAWWDEHGVLFLFWPFILCVLRPVLSAHLLVAVYKPGVFIEFLGKAVDVARDLIFNASSRSVSWPIYER
jgi:hypothetical protein